MTFPVIVHHSFELVGQGPKQVVVSAQRPVEPTPEHLNETKLAKEIRDASWE